MSILDELETTGFALQKEYGEPWKNRKIRSPYTGRMVRVGSLPAKDWKKFRPDGGNAPLSAMVDYPFDVKYVMDFYISVPKKYDLTSDYLEEVDGPVEALSKSSLIRHYFPSDNYVIKLANLSVKAVNEYCIWDDDEAPDTFEDMKFVPVDEDLDEEGRFDLFNTAENIAYKISPLEYKEYIKIINDTPKDPDESIDESFFLPSIADEMNSYLLKESESKIGELIVYQDKMMEIVDIIENNINILRETLGHNKIDDMVNSGDIDKDNAVNALSEYRLGYRYLVDANSTINDVNDRLLTYIGTITNKAV